MLILPTVDSAAPVVWRKYAIARHSPDAEVSGSAPPAIGANRSSGAYPAVGSRRISGGQTAMTSGPASSGAYPPVGANRISGGIPAIGAAAASSRGSSSIYSAAGVPVNLALRAPGEELPQVPAAPRAPAHYDLFFEVEPGGEDHKGLLHFATLTDQPPIGDGERLRLGEMHRRRYLTYEGPIADGRGSVRIVDRGSFRWMPQSDPTLGQFWMYIDGGLLSGIFSICVAPGQAIQAGAQFEFRFQFSEFPI